MPVVWLCGKIERAQTETSSFPPSPRLLASLPKMFPRILPGGGARERSCLVIKFKTLFSLLPIRVRAGINFYKFSSLKSRWKNIFKNLFKTSLFLSKLTKFIKIKNLRYFFTVPHASLEKESGINFLIEFGFNPDHNWKPAVSWWRRTCSRLSVRFSEKPWSKNLHKNRVFDLKGGVLYLMLALERFRVEQLKNTFDSGGDPHNVCGLPQKVACFLLLGWFHNAETEWDWERKHGRKEINWIDI